MGDRLAREVIRTMPATIKPNEWKLVVVLASELDDVTRAGRFPGGRVGLVERMGMGDDALKRAFSRLAELGYELRIPIGQDRVGKTRTAVRGTETTYRIPVF